MTDVTRLLEAANCGDRQAAAELLPLVYDELRKLAAHKMAREKPGQTLDATALVHEAYLRLVPCGASAAPRDPAAHAAAAPGEPPAFENRGHFFAAAAEAMRRILVETARRKQADKHGGNLARADFDLAVLEAQPPPDELLAVDQALDELAKADPQAATLVKLRYYVGMSVADAAKALNVSTRTAERLWTYARAWLRRTIEGA